VPNLIVRFLSKWNYPRFNISWRQKKYSRTVLLSSLNQRTHSSTPQSGNDCKHTWKQLGQHYQKWEASPQAQKTFYYNLLHFITIFTIFLQFFTILLQFLLHFITIFITFYYILLHFYYNFYYNLLQFINFTCFARSTTE
jgi:hypothetical protein